MTSYIVTRTHNGFNAGEHICFGPDGSLLRIEAQAWIDAADVAHSIEGLEFLPDRTWLDHNPAWQEKHRLWISWERARLLKAKANLELRLEALQALEAA